MRSGAAVPPARSAVLRHGLLALGLVGLLAGAAPADARPVSEPERKLLEETVGRFDGAMRANDFAAVSQTIPPKVMDFIAGNAGISVDDLRKVLVRQMSRTVNEVKIVSFGMDLGGATPRELPDGSPFLLIPTQTVLDAGDGTQTAVRSHTLAFLDEGRWFLLRVSDEAQVKILKQVYPGFAAETFPASTMEAVKP